MTEENVSKDEATQEEQVAEASPDPETTDAPEGVADAEDRPEAAAPEGEPAGGPEPPGGEPATEEPEPAPQAVGEGPAGETDALSTEEAPAEETSAEEAPADESVAEAEAAAAPVDEPAEAEPVAEQPAEAARKKKKKRLPRALRPQRTKAARERPAERKAITRLPKPEHDRGRRQERQGKVVSAAADKTIVVRVDVVKVHPMYKKVIKRSTKFHAHDEGNEAKIGDIVRIVETRPISRLKRWRLQEIVEAAK